jgi:uncharacterized membrane protein (DUF2068 family)
MKDGTTRTHRHHDLGFILIGVFKLIKALLLFGVGIGTLSLLNESAAHAVRHWARQVQVSAHDRFIQDCLVKIGIMNRQDVVVVSLVSFLYGAIFFTEGIGLLMERVWAEHLTVVLTASFLPVEIYELHRRFTVPRVLVLVANVVVVGYLILRLQQRQRALRRPG